MLRRFWSRPVMVLLAGLLVAFGLLAQEQVIPLRNWAAPLYWQASAAEAALSAKPGEARWAEISPPAAGSASGPLVFIAITPCRLMDTRGYGQTGAFGPPALSPYAERTVPIPTHPSCTVPVTAGAYSLNLTVVPATTLDFLSAWPTGQPYPGVSTLNAPLGGIVANAAIVPAGTSGSIQVVAGTRRTGPLPTTPCCMTGSVQPPVCMPFSPGGRVKSL